jgi:hypothetical protein
MGLPTEVYKDLLSPSIKVIGEYLETATKKSFSGTEEILKYLAKQVDTILKKRDVSPTHIAYPPPYLLGHIVTQMQHSADEPSIKEMFARLLATSMDSLRSDEPHPSFVALIQQLTSDEAKILKHIASLSVDKRCWGVEYTNAWNRQRDSLEKLMKQVCIDSKITNLNKCGVYIENLIRLQILCRGITDIETSERQGIVSGDEEDGYDYGMIIETTYSEYIEVTSLGNAFLQTCVLD